MIEDPTKADAWQAPSLSVSGADPPDAKSLGHHQMCSSDRWSPSSPPPTLSSPLPRGRLGHCGACQDCLVTPSGPPQKARGNISEKYPRPPALWWDSPEGQSVRTSRVCSGTGPLLARVVTAHGHMPVVSAHLPVSVPYSLTMPHGMTSRPAMCFLILMSVPASTSSQAAKDLVQISDCVKF